MMTTSTVHIDHDPAAHLAVEQVGGGGDGFTETDFAGDGVEPGEVEVAPEALPRLRAHRRRRHDAVDAVQGDATQDERRDAGREVHALGQSAGGDGAPILGRGAGVGQRVAADGVDDAGPALLAQGFARRREFVAVDDVARAQRFEMIGFGNAAGGSNDAVTQLGEQGDGDATDTTVGAGDENRLVPK